MVMINIYVFASQVRKEINGKTLKETKEDKTLPICWKGNKPFQKIQVRDYFKPLQLSFPKAKSVQLVLQPEAYLIVTVSWHFFYTTKHIDDKEVLN